MRLKPQLRGDFNYVTEISLVAPGNNTNSVTQFAVTFFLNPYIFIYYYFLFQIIINFIPKRFRWTLRNCVTELCI
jgi:hypothetical protein